MHVWLLTAIASGATPWGGVEWQPLSRADLGWVDDGRDSNLGVGEFDGTARPALSAFAGAWLSDRASLTGTLGVARLQNTTKVDGIVRQRHWGVIRPGLDARWALSAPRERRPLPWLLVGAHADLPSARDVSTGYTREEQRLADEQAWAERAMLGGVGARAGAGADVELAPGLAVGAQWALEWQVSTWLADDLTHTSSWLSGQAALVLAFRFGHGGDPAP